MRRGMLYNLTMRKLLSIVVIVILIVTISNLARGSFESYNKLKEINSNQNDLKSLKKENQELKQKVSFKQSDFFLEKEARDKLGFGKQGETTIVLQDRDFTLEEASSVQKDKSNLTKWLELLQINL